MYKAERYKTCPFRRAVCEQHLYGSVRGSGGNPGAYSTRNMAIMVQDEYTIS